MSGAHSPARPLRADAARNREALLRAAREVFAARGLDATLDEIARHAGVGTGTAYRHFANKQEIAQAIFTEDLERLAAAADAALESDEPWESLADFIESTAEQHAHDRGLYQAFTSLLHAAGTDGSAADADMAESIVGLRERLPAPVVALFERARAAGKVRPDAEATDVAVILMLLGDVYDMAAATRPELWRRYLQIIMDGLCTPTPTRLCTPALSLEELDVALVAKKHSVQAVAGRRAAS